MNETTRGSNPAAGGVAVARSVNDYPRAGVNPFFVLGTMLATAAGMALIVLWSAGATAPSAVIDVLSDGMIAIAIVFAAILIARTTARPQQFVQSAIPSR